jgi:hypothetical protein
MISKKYQIESFLDAIEGKTYTEAISLAKREVTEAEHLLLIFRSIENDIPIGVIGYVEGLKEFILFFRYSVLKKRFSKDRYNKLFCPHLRGAKNT